MFKSSFLSVLAYGFISRKGSTNSIVMGAFGYIFLLDFYNFLRLMFRSLIYFELIFVWWRGLASFFCMCITNVICQSEPCFAFWRDFWFFYPCNLDLFLACVISMLFIFYFPLSSSFAVFVSVPKDPGYCFSEFRLTRLHLVFILGWYYIEQLFCIF